MEKNVEVLENMAKPVRDLDTVTVEIRDLFARAENKETGEKLVRALVRFGSSFLGEVEA